MVPALPCRTPVSCSGRAGTKVAKQVWRREVATNRRVLLRQSWQHGGADGHAIKLVQIHLLYLFPALR